LRHFCIPPAGRNFWDTEICWPADFVHAARERLPTATFTPVRADLSGDNIDEHVAHVLSDLAAGAVVEAGKTVLAVLESGGADILDARSLVQAEARVRAAEAAVAQAVAQRARAVANANLQREDFARQKLLFASGALSRQEFDAAETRVTTTAQEARAAEFAGQIAEFEAAQARALLLRGQPAGAGARGEPLVILSPVSGRVLRVMQESERLVPAGFALLEVGDPTDLEARIEVLSRDGVAIQPGARVQLEQWGGPMALNARVRVVEPSAFTKVSALGVEEQRVYVIVDFTDPLEVRRSLGDNYRVEARIETWSGQNILKVPAGALFQRGAQWQTYVVEGKRAVLRTVRVGRSSGREGRRAGGGSSTRGAACAVHVAPLAAVAPPAGPAPRIPL
jgi:HlyD family secretion protein